MTRQTFAESAALKKKPAQAADSRVVRSVMPLPSHRRRIAYGELRAVGFWDPPQLWPRVGYFPASSAFTVCSGQTDCVSFC
jgi:hypothetical protein